MASSPPQSMFILQEPSILPVFENVVDDKYNCVKCNTILTPPVKQLLCGHRMCQKCLSELVQSAVNTKCPGHEEDCIETNLTNPEHVYPDFGTEKELKKLRVYCRNKEYGCHDILAWSKLEEHIVTCPFKPMSCKFSEYGCKESMSNKKLKIHIDNCGFKPIECKHCSKMVPKCEMDGGHEDMCLSRPKVCRFKSMGCEYTGLIDDVKNHMNRDHKDHLDVLFEELKKMKRSESETKKELEQLKNENFQLKNDLQKAKKENTENKQKFEKKLHHMQKLTASNAEKIGELDGLKEPAKLVPALQQKAESHDQRITRLENRQPTSGSVTMSDDLRGKITSVEQAINMHDIRLAEYDLRFQCLETASYDGTLVWKIRDFKRRKQEAVAGRTLSLYSQPFYTSKFGYKMCARVYLNGDGMGKGTHMSLFFVIMKGDYDALLPWPFRQKVTLTLVDQDTGRHNLSDTFRPDPTSTSFKKPLTEMNVASGCPLFVAQTVLESKAHLKDDTIFIKVSVETGEMANH